MVNLLKQVGDPMFSNESYNTLVKNVFDSFSFDKRQILNINYKATDFGNIFIFKWLKNSLFHTIIINWYSHLLLLDIIVFYY